jgi:hypothetical protein
MSAAPAFLIGIRLRGAGQYSVHDRWSKAPATDVLLRLEVPLKVLEVGSVTHLGLNVMQIRSDGNGLGPAIGLSWKMNSTNLSANKSVLVQSISS